MITELSSRNENYACAFSDLAQIKVAVDHVFVNDFNHSIIQAKEIAFFPPVTGVDDVINKIQENDFDSGAIFNSVANGRKDFGIKVLFTGVVKDFSHNSRGIEKLFIEHYPLMAEKQLRKICENALERWRLWKFI